MFNTPKQRSAIRHRRDIRTNRDNYVDSGSARKCHRADDGNVNKSTPRSHYYTRYSIDKRRRFCFLYHKEAGSYLDELRDYEMAAFDVEEDFLFEEEE